MNEWQHEGKENNMTVIYPGILVRQGLQHLSSNHDCNRCMGLAMESLKLYSHHF